MSPASRVALEMPHTSKATVARAVAAASRRDKKAALSAVVRGLQAFSTVLAVGLVLSVTQMFECCGGLVHVPFPGVGYMRWDLAVSAWWGVGYFTGLVVISVCFSWYGFIETVSANRRGVTPPPLRRIGAIAARIGSSGGGVLIAAIFIAANDPWDQQVPPPGELAVEPHVDYNRWALQHVAVKARAVARRLVDGNLEVDFVELGQPDVTRTFTSEGYEGRPSGRAILTPKLCADAVDFALENTDAWTNTGGFQLAQSPYMTFGMDANFMNGRNATEIFAAKLFGLPYSPIYGFQRYLGHDTRFMLNGDYMAFYSAIKGPFLRRLAPQLDRIRLGIAEHVQVTPDRVVLGGDPGSAIEDMFPAGIIVQLPHVTQAWMYNPHVDSTTVGSRLQERLDHCKEPRMVGFTLMLQIPSGGAGLWWWHLPDDKENPPWHFAEEYEVGHFMSVHEDLYHSIAPWENRYGWLDSPRFTMQMFAKRCSGVYYVFH